MTIETTSVEVNQENWTRKKRRMTLPAGSAAFVELDGAEPAFVLVHGFSDTSRSYSLLAPHLAGRRMVIPDIRNHGASFGHEPTGLTDYAADLLALSEALNLQRPILVGHSLGGMIAIQACFERPAFFGGLVVLASSLMPKIGNRHPMATGVSNLCDPICPSDPFYEYWHHCKHGVPASFLGKVAAEASEMPASRWRTIMDMIRRVDLRGQTSRLRDIETLVINGSEDELFDAGDRAVFASALPWAKFQEIDGCGHNLHWEEPARVAAIVSAQFPPSQTLR